MHLRVERWTLDEVPLVGKLFFNVTELLYWEDLFRRGILIHCGGKGGGRTLTLHPPGTKSGPWGSGAFTGRGVPCGR
jgi:hypothetical protein